MMTPTISDAPPTTNTPQPLGRGLSSTRPMTTSSSSAKPQGASSRASLIVGSVGVVSGRTTAAMTRATPITMPTAPPASVATPVAQPVAVAGVGARSSALLSKQRQCHCLGRRRQPAESDNRQGVVIKILKLGDNVIEYGQFAFQADRNP